MAKAQAQAISTTHPGCLILLIDESRSMGQPVRGQIGGQTKAEASSEAVNRLLQNLIFSCSKGRGEVRKRFFVSVLLYGNGEVRFGIEGALAGQELVSITDLAANPLRVDEHIEYYDGEALPVSFPVWVDVQPTGNTPMCQAIREATRIADTWARFYSDSAPPIVINVSDGVPSDGGGDLMAQLASELTAVSTDRGRTCFFNLQFSTRTAEPLLFPSSAATVRNDFAERLFEASSLLPAYIVDRAAELGFTMEPGARGFAFNADMSTLVDFLTIGSVPGPLV